MRDAGLPSGQELFMGEGHLRAYRGCDGMHFAQRVVSLGLVVTIAIALFAIPGPSQLVVTRFSVSPTVLDFPELGSRLPFSSTTRFVDPELRDATGLVSVAVAMDASAPTIDVAEYLSAARAMPAFGDTRLVLGSVDASRIGELQSLPSVFTILKDRPIGFEMPKEIAFPPRLQADSRFTAKLAELGFQGSRHTEIASIQRESLTGEPEVSMRDVVNFTGARRTWTELGVDGTGVTIAVVDTGVDHGTFNLGDGAAARNASGFPSSFDPDGSTFAWTTLSVMSYPEGSFRFINTAGKNPLIWTFIPGDGPLVFSWSDLFNETFFPADMNITGILASQSGTYRFGVLNEWSFFPPFVFFNLYPVLVVDTTTPGVYDAVYLDISFNWWLWGYDPSPNPDFSFADESVLQPAGGTVVAARDFDSDGFPDMSAGSLAYALDLWGADPNPADAMMIAEPIDPDGDYIVMVYDWVGHGTSVAGSAAGRESSHSLAGPGTAPGAQIMGIPIFSWFNVIEGWLWAAGFDLVNSATPAAVPNYGVVYGNWTYTGNHKADIISNSWGVSEWLTTPWLFQWPWYDVLTVVEDALMTPGYADPDYPGTVMVHAGGNGAAGYGTVTGPGYSNLAITVGASTSMNWTRLLWGTSGGLHNDVMSWSARGPTALGAPKPDIVQVGAFAWTSAPVWSGMGDGYSAFTLFGGTSQATPVTLGSAALVIQAYEQGHGSRPSPFTVKSILKSTAEDLGYDPFVQGAGQVNVYDAAAYALGNAGIMVTSPATWDNVRPQIAAPWGSASLFYDQQVGTAPPEGPIDDTSWFAGPVRPGESTAAEFTVAPADGTVSGSISAVWHRRIDSMSISGVTGPLTGWPVFGNGWLNVLSLTDIPANADLMLVRSAISYDFLDSDGDYIWDNRSGIVVGDWIDANTDGIATADEVTIINYGFNTGTTVEARVGMPDSRFVGSPLLLAYHFFNTGELFVPMPIEIQVEFYERQSWPWISVPATFSSSSDSPERWMATMEVPTDADPGVYEGQILVAPDVGKVIAVPVSVVIPRVIDDVTLSAPLTSPGSTLIYDSSSVNGYFDWRWRYESGDWKLWFVDVVDPTTLALRVNVSWTGANTDVDIWSITPSGIPGDLFHGSSFSPYQGSGVFLWSTSTGTTEDFVVVGTSSGFDQPAPGLYTFALHNVLLGGAPPPAAPEALTGAVSAAKLAPRGPVTLVVQPGTTVSLPFTLSTGFDLNNFIWYAASPPTLPMTTWPLFDPMMVAAGESLLLWANLTIPADTAEGTYDNYIFLSSEELPFTSVRVNVVVDSTKPEVSILTPGASAYLRGSVTLEVAVLDVNNISSVSFTAGAASDSMSMDPTTGLWIATWDSTGTADGVYTVEVTAVDAAGNQVSDSLSVTVDNTAPVVTISEPSTDAKLRGTNTIAWSTTEANLEQVWLIIDGATRDVTGMTALTWDTNTVGDGSHTIEVRALDRAGNEGVASFTVTTDNVAAATTNAMLIGLSIGSVVAAAAGLFIGFFFSRRRRPPSPWPEEAVEPPPPEP